MFVEILLKNSKDVYYMLTKSPKSKPIINIKTKVPVARSKKTKPYNNVIKYRKKTLPELSSYPIYPK